MKNLNLKGPGSSATQFGPFSDPTGSNTRRKDGDDDFSDFGVGHVRNRKGGGCSTACPSGGGGCADCPRPR